MTARDGVLVSSPQMLFPDDVLRPGWVRLEAGKVGEVGTGRPPGTADLECAYLTPGFVDVHCHGGGGHSFATTDPDEAVMAAAAHREHGSTAVMASMVTASIDELETQVATLAPLARDGVVAGIHLEGPWLSPSHRGAHDPHLLRNPLPADIDRLLAVADGQLRMVTLAPELPGAHLAIEQLTRQGVVVAVGHTDANSVQLRAAVDAGARVVTHVCNAMRPILHRQPGPVAAALNDRRVAVELVADGVHVHPEMVALLTRAALGDVLLVTDAMAAAGADDGPYRLGSLDVDVVDGVARLRDGGAIAGSTLTMDRAVRTAVFCGMPPERALASATRLPAQALGLPRAEFVTGGAGPVLALDEAFEPLVVWPVAPRGGRSDGPPGDATLAEGARPWK